MIIFLYSFVSIVLTIFSYGFVDLNLQLSSNPFYSTIQPVLRHIVFQQRLLSTSLYVFIVGVLFVLYWLVLKRIEKKQISLFVFKKILLITLSSLVLAFPAFSYDVFNYIATAKVAFEWRENPWIIMPVDIPNDPVLAYTRAANKTALYGPTWIYLTFFPHIAGRNSVWLSILSFKMLVVLFFLGFIYLLYKTTKNLWQTAFFALNPLVLLEVILGGHNDIVMMVLSIGGLLFMSKGKFFRTSSGFALWFVSLFVKGATVCLLPVFLLIRHNVEKAMFVGYWCMFFVFLLTPFREEMYPWYAVWWLCFLVFLRKDRFGLLYNFSFACTIGLLLRHAPYMYMGYYEGPGPLLRILLTVIPVLLFILFSRKKFFRIYLNSVKAVVKRV